jgi:hypothetical protein
MLLGPAVVAFVLIIVMIVRIVRIVMIVVVVVPLVAVPDRPQNMVWCSCRRTFGGLCDMTEKQLALCMDQYVPLLIVSSTDRPGTGCLPTVLASLEAEYRSIHHTRSSIHGSVARSRPCSSLIQD